MFKNLGNRPSNRTSNSLSLQLPYTTPITLSLPNNKPFKNTAATENRIKTPHGTLENGTTNLNKLLSNEITTTPNESISIYSKRCGFAICHPFATCDLQKSVCLCNRGFEGDGYYSCE